MQDHLILGFDFMKLNQKLAIDVVRTACKDDCRPYMRSSRSQLTDGRLNNLIKLD